MNTDTRPSSAAIGANAAIVVDAEAAAAAQLAARAFAEPSSPPSIAELRERLVGAYRDEIARLEREVDRFNAELETLRTTRESTVEQLVAAQAELAQLTGERPAKRSTPRQRSKSGEFVCGIDGCERSFDTEHGLGVHRRRSHKPPTIAATAPRPAAASTGKVLRCGELAGDDVCNAEFPTLKELSNHTITAHQRQPTPGERIPVTPDAAR